jgi:hypothetical protein
MSSAKQTGVVRATKKITDTKMDRVIPVKSKVISAGHWDTQKTIHTEGAAQFRLFIHDETVT